QDVLRDMLVIVAFLSVADPRERPPEARQQADAAHRQFADPQSDFVGVLNLWNAWSDARDELTRAKLRDWCRKHFVGYLRMREWREVHRQLKLAMASIGTRGSGRETRKTGAAERDRSRAGTATSKAAKAQRHATGKSDGDKVSS